VNFHKAGQLITITTRNKKLQCSALWWWVIFKNL